MKLTTTATAIAWAGLAVATQSHATAAPSADTERTLRLLDDKVRDIQQENEVIWRMVQNGEFSREAYVNRLNALAGDINDAGKKINTLEAEKDSLPAWERQTVESALPLLQSVASNTESAMQLFNGEQIGHFVTQYSSYAQRVDDETGKAGTIVGGSLKLAKLREQERHIEHNEAAAGVANP